MPTFEEMTTWTPVEIRTNILASLPEGWRFNLEREQNALCARFFSPDGDCLWVGGGFDERILLFDAYVWLCVWDKEVTNPNWKPKEPKEMVPVKGKVSLPGVEIPDHEDLDPDEILAVYSGLRTRR